jgi:surface polysaccharide O-acyltransferase-like enzyme
MEPHPENCPNRCVAVDAAKLVAAAAVVWIHVTNCEESRHYLALCRFAVPFFTCAAVYYVLHKASTLRELSFTAFCAQRARRLYLPFCLWALFYLAVRAAKHAVVGEGSPILLSPAVLLNGTTHHLWFLPFICFVSIGAFVLGRWLRELTPRRGKSLALIFMLGGMALALVPDPITIRTVDAPVTYFLDHALDALPAALFGAAVFCLIRVFTPAVWLRVAVLVVALLCISWEFLNGGDSLAPHVAGASLLFFAVTQKNRTWMSPVGNWGHLAFTIYLVHVLFVEGLQAVEERFGGSDSLSADLSIWALALFASAMTAKLMARFRLLRWAFPQ